MSVRYVAKLVCEYPARVNKPCEWCEFHEPEQLGLILRNKLNNKKNESNNNNAIICISFM